MGDRLQDESVRISAAKATAHVMFNFIVLLILIGASTANHYRPFPNRLSEAWSRYELNLNGSTMCW